MPPASSRGPVLDVGGVPIQAGDKVMMLRNDRRLGVRNGNRGVVLDVDPDEHTMRVRLARGDRRRAGAATSTPATSATPTR